MRSRQAGSESENKISWGSDSQLTGGGQEVLELLLLSEGLDSGWVMCWTGGGVLEGSCWAPLQENTGVKTSAREVQQKSRIGGKIKK